MDFDTRQVIARGRSVRLTPKEFELLRYFVTHANKVLSHRELLQAVWGPDYGDQVDYLRVFVNQLRKKIEAEAVQPRVSPDRAVGRLPPAACRPTRDEPTALQRRLGQSSQPLRTKS